MPFWIHIISINLCEQAKKINCLPIIKKPIHPSLFRPSINQSLEEKTLTSSTHTHTHEGSFQKIGRMIKELFVHAMPCALFPNQIYSYIF